MDCAGELSRVQALTIPARAQLCPELVLRLVTPTTPAWHANAAQLKRHGVEHPFWAFCWPGGDALARFVLDHPAWVAGRRVLDFGAGCGVAGIGAARAGALRVTAAEIDPLALAACALNASLNDVALEPLLADARDEPPGPWDVILAADVLYDAAQARQTTAWLQACARAGMLVLVADAARTALCESQWRELASYLVPTHPQLEDHNPMVVRILTVAAP